MNYNYFQQMLAIIAAGAGGVVDTYSSTGLIGGNVLRAIDFASDDIWTDALVTARNFAPTSSPYGDFAPGTAATVTLNGSGWPTQDFVVVVGTLMDRRPDSLGVYSGSFTGQATVTIRDGSGDTVSASYSAGTNRTTFTYTMTPGGGPTRALQFTGLSGDFADLKIIRPGYPADGSVKYTTYAQQTFSRLKAIRTLDLIRCNYNLTEVTWAQRQPGNKKAGEANWEQAIDLANDFGQDIWICIPPAVDDDYIVQLAALFASRLDSQRKVLPEYGNEMWNASFTQYNYALNQAEIETGAYSNVASASGAVSKITAISRTSNVVTVTHNGYQQPGANIFVFAAHAATLKTTYGTNPVVTIISPTQFSYPSTGADIASTAGGGFIAYTKNLSGPLMQGTPYRAAGTVQDILMVREYWIAKRIKFIADAFSSALGSRSRPIFACQLGGLGAQSNHTIALQWMRQQYGVASSYLWGYAGGPYISPNSANLTANNADTTGTTCINEIVSRTEVQYANGVHSLVGVSALLGLQPCWYECGIDTDTATGLSDTVARAVHRHATNRAFFAGLLAYGAAAGIKLMNIYGTKIQDMDGGVTAGNVRKNSWYWAERPSQLGAIGASTGPKVQGVDDVVYAAVPVPRGKYTAPCTVPANDWLEGHNGNHFASQNGYFWGTAATTGDFLVTVPADGVYNIVVKGGNSAASTVDVLVNGVLAATANLPAVTLSGSTVFGDSQVIPVTLTKGNHVVRLYAATGTRYLKSFNLAAA